MDNTTRLILNALLDDSRLSLRKIAGQVNASPTTVLKKVKQLEKDGIIKSYTALLDYDKLGFELQAIIEVRISKGKLFEVEKKISKHPNVQAVYDVTGDFDVILLTKFRKTQELDDFVKHIQTYDFIERTHTMLVLNTIKENVVRV